MRRILVVAGLLLVTFPAWAQTPTFGPKPEHIKRLTEFISQSEGPYKKLADGIWETSYKGTNVGLVRVRIATAGDGVFFVVSLAPREKLTLSPDFLLRLAEFNAEYDYVKVALEKTSLDLRIDAHVALLDLAMFRSLENQAALAADAAHGAFKTFLP